MNQQSHQQQPSSQSQGSQQTPPRSHEPRPKRSRTMSKEVLIALIGSITTIVVTIITVILGPTLLKSVNGQTSPTPVTSPSPVFSPTLTPIDPQKLYDQITRSTPILNDSLSHKSLNDWDEEQDTKYRCTFVEGAYHASLQVTQNYVECLANSTNFPNFAYQVQMTITKGDRGGILFRFDDANARGYSFIIDQSGAYALQLWRGSGGTRENLLNGFSSFIKTGPNQTNLIAVVADGSNIHLYVNHHYIDQANDTTYQSGKIGVFAENSTSSSAEVVFSNAQVWKPSS